MNAARKNDNIFKMSLKDKQKSLKKITAIALAVLFLDQTGKFIILKNIFFAADIHKNYNALFGLPIDFNSIFIFFAFLIFIYRFLPNKETKFPTENSISLFALGLILGGITGNLIDRFFYGHIIDYINFFDLFVFNIADLAICLGALLLSWKVLRK